MKTKRVKLFTKLFEFFTGKIKECAYCGKNKLKSNLAIKVNISDDEFKWLCWDCCMKLIEKGKLPDDKLDVKEKKGKIDSTGTEDWAFTGQLLWEKRSQVID